jgi:endonuclease G, mitochondrial
MSRRSRPILIAWIVVAAVALFTGPAVLPADIPRTSHCLGGCPLGNSQENDLVLRSIYALSFNHQTRIADWVAYRVTSDAIGIASMLSRTPRADPFIPDALQPEDYIDSYAVAGVERHYFVPLISFAATPFWQEVNFLSNMVPRNPELNRGSWYGLEWAIRNLVNRAGELYVLSGPLFDPANPQKPLRTEKAHRVPSGFFLVVASEQGEVAAFTFEQQLPFHVHHCQQRTSLGDVEEKSGLDLLPEYPAWPLADLSDKLGCLP